MKKILYLPFVLIFALACSIEPFNVDSTTTGNFDLFFNYLKHDYSFRDSKYQKGRTIEDIRQKYLPAMQTDQSSLNFWVILYKIINHEIRDPHLQYPPEIEAELANSHAKIYAELRAEKEHLDTIDGKDTVYPTSFKEINIIAKKTFYEYGTAKNNPSIGYVHINDFNKSVGGSSSSGMHPDIKDINMILDELNAKGVKSMIVDIRSPAGGTNEVPRYIAARFATKSYPYMIEEYPEGTGYKTKEWTVEPSSETGFRTGKIALLSNGGTCSGGEFFTLMIKERGNMIHIGSNSLGCPGNVVAKPLAFGISFTMTNSRTRLLDGTEYLRVGITPKDFIVKNDATFGITTFEDKVIAKAIAELSK